MKKVEVNKKEVGKILKEKVDEKKKDLDDEKRLLDGVIDSLDDKQKVLDDIIFDDSCTCQGADLTVDADVVYIRTNCKFFRRAWILISNPFLYLFAGEIRW